MIADIVAVDAYYTITRKWYAQMRIRINNHTSVDCTLAFNQNDANLARALDIYNDYSELSAETPVLVAMQSARDREIVSSIALHRYTIMMDEVKELHQHNVWKDFEIEELHRHNYFYTGPK